jgi:hypothetical protein
MLTAIYILKTNSQYVQMSVKSRKTTCKNIQNTVKISTMCTIINRNVKCHLKV